MRASQCFICLTAFSCQVFDHAHETIGGIWPALFQCASRHALRAFRVLQDGRDLFAQNGGIQPAFGNQDCRVGLDQPAGVRGLVVGGGGGEGNQDRRAADHGQVGDRGGAGARDDQLRLGHAGGKVGEEGLHVGGDAGPGIELGDPGAVLVPGLVRDRDPVEERAGKRRDRLGHHVGEDARALRSADDEDLHR
jgi:hypothetical protein